MAGGAVLGSGFIEEHSFGGNDFGQLVAFRAPHVLMSAAQRKLRPLLVIEKRRLPLHTVVTLRAARNIAFRELLPVDVLVAFLTLHRRGFEIHVDQFCFEVGRFVAIGASGRAMRSRQRKFRLGVVEARKLFPGFRGVARLASRR